jgi:LysM repeat protein
MRRCIPLLACLLVGLLGWLSPRPAKAGDCIHEVAKGDTLSRIAARNGVSESALIAANPALKKNPNLLRLGQKVDVCAAQKASKAAAKKANAKAPRCGKRGRLLDHEVRPGESLSKIASQYGVQEQDITHHNAKLRKRPDLLRSGETIKVCVDRSRVRNHKACNYETPLFEHEVVPGEHLGQIAGRYGVRRGSIVKLNASLRKNPNMLRVGQKLRVCPDIAPRERTKLAYTVQSGDTFGEIAQKYGLTRSELLRYQQGKLKDPGSLRTGQRLVVWADGGTVAGFGGVDRDTGVLKAGMQLPPGRHYVVKWAAGAWGTSKTIRLIQSAVASYKRKRPGGPKVHVGDISKRGGGKFPPHLSHQHGRDVDVGYVLEGKYAHETRFKSANADNLDVARSWALVKAFIDTNQVRYIFMDYRIQKLLYEYAKKQGVSEDTLDELFQYPRGKGRTHGLIRHWKGHRNHFHVRFDR